MCCLSFSGIVTELLFFLVGSFVVIREPFLRVGNGKRGGLWGRVRELCNYKVFKTVLFSFI